MKSSRYIIWAGMVCLGLLGIFAGEGCSTAPSIQEESSFTKDGGRQVEVTKETNLDESAKADAVPDRAGPEFLVEVTDKDAGEQKESTKEQTPESTPEQQSKDQFSPDTGGGTIKIYLKGDLTPQTFTDKYSSQTPTNYQIALSRYFIMLNAQDPKPQLCFHLKKVAVADMSKDNLMGSCRTQTLKTGLYTYGKVKVEWVRYTVDGVMHYNGIPLSGKLTFLRAYSDTTYQGKAYKAGQGRIKFAGPTTVEIPYTFPQVPTTPGLKFSLVKGEFFITFPYTKPLPIDQTSKDQHWARMHWKIHNAFRWIDKALPSYKTDIWDVAVTTSTTEEVKLFGVSGYKITSSVR